MPQIHDLSAQLLAKPAKHAVREIAVARLGEVSKAYDRLSSGEADDLHDLRVALRRLRSWLRAFRPEFADTVKRKTRRRLSRIADATNLARDAEVALAWIADAKNLAGREKVGAKYMTKRLRREVEAARADHRKVLQEDLPHVLSVLEEQLGAYWIHQTLRSPQPPELMAVVTRDAIIRQAELFGVECEQIGPKGDPDAAHRARIAGKRLRYLLESLDDDPHAATLIEKLAAFQDVLGAARDTHRIAIRIVKEVGECAAREAREVALELIDVESKSNGPPLKAVRPGLVALAKRAHERERGALKAFSRRWRKREVSRIVTDAGRVADSLVADDAAHYIQA